MFYMEAREEEYGEGERERKRKFALDHSHDLICKHEAGIQVNLHVCVNHGSLDIIFVCTNNINKCADHPSHQL